MGVRAPNTAPINQSAGACSFRAPPRHGSRKNKAAVTARRIFTRTCSSPPLPDQAMAVGLRCRTVDPQTRFVTTRWQSIRGVGMPPLKLRYPLRGPIRCLLAITVGALSLFPSRSVDKISYLVSLLQEAKRKRASSGKHIIATCPSPDPGDAHRFYGTCFNF